MYDNTKGGFASRRKRDPNIFKTVAEKREISTGIDWENVKNYTESIDQSEQDLIEDYEESNYELGEEYEELDEKSMENIKICDKNLNISKFRSRKQQEQMEKLTIYLDKNLIQVLKILKKNKMIESYSQCVKEALVEYLAEN